MLSLILHIVGKLPLNPHSIFGRSHILFSHKKYEVYRGPQTFSGIKKRKLVFRTKSSNFSNAPQKEGLINLLNVHFPTIFLLISRKLRRLIHNLHTVFYFLFNFSQPASNLEPLDFLNDKEKLIWSLDLATGLLKFFIQAIDQNIVSHANYAQRIQLQ